MGKILEVESTEILYKSCCKMYLDVFIMGSHIGSITLIPNKFITLQIFALENREYCSLSFQSYGKQNFEENERCLPMFCRLKGKYQR